MGKPKIESSDSLEAAAEEAIRRAMEWFTGETMPPLEVGDDGPTWNSDQKRRSGIPDSLPSDIGGYVDGIWNANFERDMDEIGIPIERFSPFGPDDITPPGELNVRPRELWKMLVDDTIPPALTDEQKAHFRGCPGEC